MTLARRKAQEHCSTHQIAVLTQWVSLVLLQVLYAAASGPHPSSMSTRTTEDRYVIFISGTPFSSLSIMIHDIQYRKNTLKVWARFQDVW